MKKNNYDNTQDLRTRREVLRKTGTFIIPAVATYKIADMAVAASGSKFMAWPDKPPIE